MITSRPEPLPGTPGAIRVTVGVTAQDRRIFLFNEPFRIGRAEDVEVRIPEDVVSRHHAIVEIVDGQWQVRDLNSSNGTFVGGARVSQAAISQAVTIRLGIEGPEVTLKPEAPPPPPPPPAVDPLSMTSYVKRYFADPDPGETVGEHTMMIRSAFRKVQTRQKRRYGIIMGVLLLVGLVAAGIAVYQHRQIQKQTAIARDIFYNMKSLDVDIAALEKLVQESNNGQGLDQIRKYRKRRLDMQANYEKFLTALQVYDPKMTEEERLIMRVARVFGECELNMPPEFMSEVKTYIGKWQSSNRLANAVATARAKGYTSHIVEELLEQNLPPQFFYLALQESNFDPYISGPETYMGIAKGMWQFIPQTAVKYGLRIGPLADSRRPDPADDRHNWEKATNAASRYLKDIYTTDAQASGLLVMASYNWGEDKVVRLIRSLPANPHDRNFWRLLTEHRDKLPQQTYDYVFYITSAAVIGENPKLFGFKFDNPLASPAAR